MHCKPRRRHEIVRLERGLLVLEIIVGIAPLLGLVGTIAGMMHVFGAVGQTGLNDAASLATGIAFILRTTLRTAHRNSVADRVELLYKKGRGTRGGDGSLVRCLYQAAICRARPLILMHFYVRKRRNTPAVIIVALIDVLVVLVIFLLVTTTFKQQAALEAWLPDSSESKKPGANENPPFIVKYDGNGVYYVEKMAVTFQQLEDQLKARVAKNPNLALAINADENAPWGKVVKLRDAAAAANVKSLVAFTKQPGKP